VTRLVLDDHLLRDLLADRCTAELLRLLRSRQPATTNLYYHRLCRSVVAAEGGQLTGALPSVERAALGRALITLPSNVDVVPMQALSFDMAVLAQRHGLSTLGAEAVAAAAALGAPLCVWAGDDGPRIRAVAAAEGVSYRTLVRP
jgi:hypothetical protein